MAQTRRAPSRRSASILRSRARHWIVDGVQAMDDGPPDLDSMVAEVATAISEAFRAEGQAVREQIEAAVARGETGYIQVHRPTVDPSERRAKSWEEIAPLIAAQARELQEKVASLGVTPEEASLLGAAEEWLQRFGPERDGGQEP